MIASFNGWVAGTNCGHQTRTTWNMSSCSIAISVCCRYVIIKSSLVKFDMWIQTIHYHCNSWSWVYQLGRLTDIASFMMDACRQITVKQNSVYCTVMGGLITRFNQIPCFSPGRWWPWHCWQLQGKFWSALKLWILNSSEQHVYIWVVWASFSQSPSNV